MKHQKRYKPNAYSRRHVREPRQWKYKRAFALFCKRRGE